MLRVPPVTVRLGERSGASSPLQVQVRNLPAPGRPATFLGGVGRLDELDAKARPATIRAGQDLEYRIRLIGPAARGSSRPPELAGFDQLPVGLKIEVLPAETVADPPSEVFRFRLRPTRAGEASLPPVAIAYFEPKLGQYLTKTTSSVPIKVIDVAAFDPQSLDYGSSSPDAADATAAQESTPGPASLRTRWVEFLLVLSSCLLLFPTAAVVYRVVVRTHRRRLSDPARFARGRSPAARPEGRCRRRCARDQSVSWWVI